MNTIIKKVIAWCKEEDWIIIAVPGLALLITLLLFKLYIMAGMCGCIAVAVLLWEYISVKTTGSSISDDFGYFFKKHKFKGWVILTFIMLVFWSLVIHFAIRS